MIPIQTASLLATCGDVQTGSSKVFANGNGVTRCKVDTAVGLILAPGSPSVIVEGFPVSVVGDWILAHPPCPLPPTHCAAFVNPIGEPSVLVGARVGAPPPRALGGGLGAGPGQEWNEEFGGSFEEGGGSGDFWDDMWDDFWDDFWDDWWNPF